MKLDAIPVFKPNQALTADHLNDLRKFLDYEDRLTRRALIGIGVMCGFRLDVDADASVHIAKGVAVTSEGHIIAEDAVICDRHVPYKVPVPSGEGVPPDQVAEARYPFLFPDGENQIDAWEMLTTEAEVPGGEAPPTDITAAFLSDKTVMLFLECTEESLKNCDINDCSDKGAELQYVLRRLLVRRADADAMMAQEAAVAGIPTDLSSHPGLGLKYLRVEDLGIARNGIGTYPALFARILQITARLSADLPQALRDAYGAYDYLLEDMYPVERFPDGPFPDSYFGNLWGNLAAKPFLAQYFYDYLLDAAMAYNAFVDKARAFECVCLPNAGRFPKHVLLGDPLAAAKGFAAGITTPAEFAAYDPLKATTGFGAGPRPTRRRTPWTPACAGPEREELRALFHRLTLLAHSFQLRGLLKEEIRITPSRHDEAPLGARCIPPYYAFTQQSDLFRVWSPEKTRANLLSTVYAHQFSTRNMEHPYLYRIDGETFHAVAGHVGKNLAQAMGELIVHKRVLGLDFAIEPVWMGLALADDAEGRKVDEATRQRALQAAQKIILCRMGDFEVILLTLLAALFAFLVFILRGAGRQLAADHAKVPKLRQDPTGAAGGTTAGRELAAKDIARLAAMARMDALRRPDVASFAAQRLDPKERREVSEASKKLLGEFRQKAPEKGQATQGLVGDAGETSVAGIYLSVKDDADGGSLFERVRARLGRLQIGTDNPEAVDRVFNAVTLIDATENLMAQASVPSLAQLDAPRLEAAYQNFSDRLEDYAKTAPTDPEEVDRTTAAANMAMIDYSSAVSAQATTFSSAGLLGEAQRRMLAIFQDLTLEGFARRNPGLQHRAGVPKRGTLVLAYASKAELAALMERAGPRFDKLADSLNLTRLTGSFAASISEAAKEVLNAAGGGRGSDPLSDFVVLADFCLPSKCCDADCSDIVLDGALPEKIFDLDGSGRMAVDPIIPNGLVPGRPGNIPKREELSKLLDGIGVRPGNFESRRPILTREDTSQPTRPDQPDQPDRPREPDQPERPDRPADPAEREPGVVAGQVTGAGSLASTPVPNATLLANDLQTRAATRIAVAARTGSFKTRLPAGKYQFVAQAEGFESTTLEVAVDPGSALEIALRMKKAR
jgi:hypothetical protein